jgi:hypothetical protein
MAKRSELETQELTECVFLQYRFGSQHFLMSFISSIVSIGLMMIGTYEGSASLSPTRRNVFCIFLTQIRF